MKKTRLYWHVYLTDDIGVWSSIVMEQLTAMEKTGLLEYMDSLHVNIITGSLDSSQLCMKLIDAMVSTKKTTYEIYENPYETDFEMVQHLNSSKTITEEITLKKIWIDAQNEDCYQAYFHTKGITSHIRYLQGHLIHEYLKTYYWRQLLNYHTLEHWAWVISHLASEKDNVVGPNYQSLPRPHFSGNFWWAKSDYIKTLPDPTSLDWWLDIKNNTTDVWLRTCPDRFKDEMWVSSGEGFRHYDLTCGIDRPNPASTLYLPSEYIIK